jgi:GNAT superfamily N-acetyltransferase
MTGQPSVRRAKPADVEACHEVMWASVTDFGARNGTPLHGTASDWWAGGEWLQRYLASHAAEWWVAEDPDTRQIIGYARSVERDGLLELTEFFVIPTNQSRGIGAALIERAFPVGRGDVRSIIATTDVRALRRYYAAGTIARFPILTIGGRPSSTEFVGDLTPRRLAPEMEAELEAVRKVEAGVLEYARSRDEVRWLLDGREGYLYVRGDQPVGYGFVGRLGSGPVGATEAVLLPGILLHLEDRAASAGIEQLGFEIPAPNEVATRHLLGRGFRIDPWINLLMSNRPFGAFDRFVGFGPPVFL